MMGNFKESDNGGASGRAFVPMASDPQAVPPVPASIPDAEEANCLCPTCETPLYMDIRGAIGKTERFSYRVSPEKNNMMRARAIGKQLVALDDLMRACAKDDGVKVALYLESIVTHPDHSFEFFVAALPLVEWNESKGEFVKKSAQGMEARKGRDEGAVHDSPVRKDAPSAGSDNA